MAGPVPIEDARLISRLRAADRGALDELWVSWRAPTWAVCRGMGGEPERARALFDDIQAQLPGAVRGWSLESPVCCQLSRLVWRRLEARLELPRPAGIEASVPARTATPSRDEVARRLSRVPPELRVIYLLDVFYRCPARTLAALSGWAELEVRKARAAVAWALVAEEGP